MTVPSYTVHGPSAGPGYVLVHGLGVSGRYYEPLARLLATTSRVVTPDLPGFGTSHRPDPALTIPEQAVALERVVDLAGLHRPVLVGHSMGAQVVTEMAARRPDRTRGVVLVGPVVDPAVPTAFSQGWRLVRDSALEPLPLKVQTTLDWIRAGPRSYRQSLEHMLAYRIGDRLADVQAPVEVLRGSHDPIASRAFVEALAAAAPSGRSYELPRSRHMAVSTRALAIATLCRRRWPAEPRPAAYMQVAHA